MPNSIVQTRGDGHDRSVRRAGVRLSEDERAHLEARADEHGCTLADVLRALVRADMARTKRTPRRQPSRSRANRNGRQKIRVR